MYLFNSLAFDSFETVRVVGADRPTHRYYTKKGYTKSLHQEGIHTITTTTRDTHNHCTKKGYTPLLHQEGIGTVTTPRRDTHCYYIKKGYTQSLHQEGIHTVTTPRRDTHRYYTKRMNIIITPKGTGTITTPEKKGDELAGLTIGVIWLNGWS